MKLLRICAVALLAHAFVFGTAQAQDGAQFKFQTEVSKQDNIYQSKGEAVPKGYVIGRDLGAYVSALPPEFGRSLAELGTGDRWLDIGAGEGNAILDYYRASFGTAQAKGANRAQAVAISIEDRRTFDWHSRCTKRVGGQSHLASDG